MCLQHIFWKLLLLILMTKYNWFDSFNALQCTGATQKMLLGTCRKPHKMKSSQDVIKSSHDIKQTNACFDCSEESSVHLYEPGG